MNVKLLAAALSGLVIVTVLDACSLLQSRSENAGATPRPVPQTYQITPARSASHAFELCEDAQCPRPTPKTAAASEPRARPVALTQPAAPPPAPAPAPEPKTLVVGFPNGRGQLTDQGRAVLESALEALHRASEIHIRGRTDAKGAQGLNDRLALERAAAVREFLVRNQIEAAPRITIDAQGRCCYADTNETAAGRAKNRRVEVELTFGHPRNI